MITYLIFAGTTTDEVATLKEAVKLAKKLATDMKVEVSVYAYDAETDDEEFVLSYQAPAGGAV